MIIKNDFFNKDKNYLERERDGLRKSIDKLDKRFKNSEVDREKFLKQNLEFAKRHKKLNKRIEKLDRK